MSDKERMIWLDCLRLLAGVSMLFLHATADPAGQPWVNYPLEDRIAPLFVRAVVYIARTELFLIISAFLLLLALQRRPRSYGQTIAEQTRRLLVPFLFWTAFYAAFGLIKAQHFGYLTQALAELSDPAAWGRYLLLGGVKYHMHFLPTLFALILFFPLFRLAVRYPALGLSVLVCLVIRRELDGFTYSNFWGSDLLPYLVRMVKVLTYVGYGMVAGAALGIWQRSDANTRQSWFFPILYLGGMLFLLKLIATWKTIESGQWAFSYAPGYWADFLFPVILFCGCMAMGHRRWPIIISRWAPYSFGIYLCHPIFLDFAEIWVRTSGTSLAPIEQVAVKVAFTLVATCATVVLISRISFLSWTVGFGPLPFSSAYLKTRRKALKC